MLFSALKTKTKFSRPLVKIANVHHILLEYSDSLLITMLKYCEHLHLTSSFNAVVWPEN